MNFSFDKISKTCSGRFENYKAPSLNWKPTTNKTTPLISRQTIEACYSVKLSDAITKLGTELKKKGAQHTGCCPFHNEKTPSFQVNDAKGIYKCFGCGEGGNNAVQFYMKKNGQTFPEAVEAVANDFGIVIERDDSEQAQQWQQQMERKQTLSAINEQALKVWQQFPIPEDAKRHANWQEFELVHAPDEWETIKLALKEHTPAKLHDIGLLSFSDKKERHYDFFRNRILFPIRDAKGNLIAFGGRAIDPNEKAKYINTKTTELFDKSRTLYGLHMAAGEIRKRGFAYMVEGYYDVMAMHAADLPNTVAPCGTAITPQHLQLLKRYTDTVVLVMDGDKAGKASATKAAKLAIENQLNVQVCILPDGMDPDDMVRSQADAGIELSTAVHDTLDGNTTDGLLWLSASIYNENDNPAERSNQLKEVAELLANIQDPFTQNAYVADIKKQLKLRGNAFDKLVNDTSRQQQRQLPENTNEEGHVLDGKNYTMPRELNVSFDSVREQVQKYGFFIADRRIYMSRKGGENESGTVQYYFKDVSNFSIRIIQHMQDEKKPMRLVEIENVHKKKITFDTSTDDFVSEAAFRKMIEGKGNFSWMGKGTDFERLMLRLKEDMGDGRMVHILGWQPEGFWCFNNRVVKLDGSTIIPDSFGQFEIDGTSYYIPSGNELYATNEFKFGPQKLVKYSEPETKLKKFYSMMVGVHREYAYTAILFGISSVFSDIIYDQQGSFPMLFLYGPAGTGKDQLIHATQSLFGLPTDPVDLTDKANTAKGIMRDLAQFRNMPAHWSEYRNGHLLENTLKKLWNRNGYKRGTIDHAFANEVVPVLSTLIFTGNDYPTDDALIDRIIALELTVNQFDAEADKRYNELKETILGGVSGYITQLLPMRSKFEKEFWKQHKLAVKELKKEMANLQVSSRMVQNAATLVATFNLVHEHLPLPFTKQQYLQHIYRAYEKQLTKRSTGSSIMRFWECVLAAIRDKNNPLRPNFDFRLDGNRLTLQWSAVYQAYQVRCWQLFHERAESRAVLDDELKKSTAFLEAKSSVRYSGSKTSGWVFDTNAIGSDFTNYLMAAIDAYELNQGRSGSSAETLEDKVAAAKAQKAASGADDDLPF
jgi:DNA primase catalytic core